MGRRNKVEISKNPLEATTVGKINTHRFGWLLMLFIIGLFAGAIYFLPNASAVITYIQENGMVSFDKIKEIFMNPDLANRPEIEEKAETTETNDFEMNAEETHEIGDIVISNIAYEDNKITYTVKNESENYLLLDTLEYNIEVYGTDTDHYYIPLTGGVSSEKEVEESYYVPEEVTKYVVNETYPEYELNDSNTLECSKDNQVITYKFNKNGLYEINEKGSYSNTDDEYTTTLEDYKTLRDNNLENEYYNITITEQANSFSYETVVDYTKNNSVHISNSNYYVMNTSAGKVNSLMGGKGFTCK